MPGAVRLTLSSASMEKPNMSTYFTINGTLDIPEQEADAFEERIAPWLEIAGNDAFINQGSIRTGEDVGDEGPDGHRRYCFADFYRNLGRFLPELVAEIQERTGEVAGSLFVVSTDGRWCAAIVSYEDGKTWLRPLVADAKEVKVVAQGDMKMLRFVTEEKPKKDK